MRRRWEPVGTSRSLHAAPPSSCFPLTSTYLTSLLHANTNQHFMCPAQWNDLPVAIWQGPPPAAPPPVIRRRCAGVPVAGLSVLTPLPTPHASPVIASVGMGGGVEKFCVPPLKLGQRHAILSNIWGGGTVSGVRAGGGGGWVRGATFQASEQHKQTQLAELVVWAPDEIVQHFYGKN